MSEGKLFHWTKDLGNPQQGGRLTVEGVGEVILTDEDAGMAALHKGDLSVGFAQAPGTGDYFIVSHYVNPNQNRNQRKAYSVLGIIMRKDVYLLTTFCRD